MASFRRAVCCASRFFTGDATASAMGTAAIYFFSFRVRRMTKTTATATHAQKEKQVKQNLPDNPDKPFPPPVPGAPVPGVLVAIRAVLLSHPQGINYSFQSAVNMPLGAVAPTLVSTPPL